MKHSTLLFATLFTLFATQTHGQPVDKASEGLEVRHLTPGLTDWMASMVVPVQGKTVFAASPVARGEAIVTIPFDYRYPIRLKSDLKEGPFIVVKSGAMGFKAPSFIGSSADLNCFFNDEFNESFRYRLPVCYVDRPAGTLTNYVDVSNNVPGTGQRKSLPIRAPEVEARNDGIMRSFSIEISVRKWTETTASVQWKSDREPVHFADMAVDANGSVNLLVQGKILVLKRAGKTQATNVEVLNLAVEP